MKPTPAKAITIFVAVTLAFLVSCAAPGPTATGETPHSPGDASIVDFGAVGDGQTLNTKAIQSAIDQLAAKGGGTVVVPPGTFLSGAIFLKPGVNLRLDSGAVLLGSTNKADYPKAMTRIEGHFEEWLPALVNASGTDHLRISGAGTIDGNGDTFWKEFWARRSDNPKVTNLEVERPRLMLIEDSKDVQISGITFKNSGFWNLHLYRCQDVVVQQDRFEVPSGVKCPSTDGTDIDSCQRVTIRGCVYRVDDDCIALKGSKGPFALNDSNSPPVEDIHVSDCTFERGGGVVTLGSEATIVRNVLVEKCRVSGAVNLAVLKLRPDTPQQYEDICYRDIDLDGSAAILYVRPWKQFFDLNGQPPPNSVVRNLTLSHIKGRFGSFGALQGNPGQTEIDGVTLDNMDVQLRSAKLNTDEVKSLHIKNVFVNGNAFSLPEKDAQR
jgi:polygalacturonase